MEFAPIQIKPAIRLRSPKVLRRLKTEERANGIRAYTNKTRDSTPLAESPPRVEDRRAGEWNSRLYKQNPPTRVEEWVIKIT